LANAADESSPVVAGDDLAQGKELFLEGRYEEAADRFAASSKFLNGDPQAIYFLARSYQMLAGECFRAEEQAAPDSWHTHAMRAEAYHLRNDDSQAINEYQTAARLKPEAAEIYEGLGDLYIQNNQPEQARAALEKALSLEPTRARALYLLGELYVNGKDEEKAIPYLQKALRYDANLTEAHAYLGRVYLHEGRPAAAAAEVQKALPLDIHGDLHYLLYRAYSDLGKTELAQAALKQSTEMRKGSLERDRDKLDRWMKN
jgi:tetratricopeptide (TPR) repeat protein